MICPACGYRSPDLRETCRRCGAPMRGTAEKTLGDPDVVADDRFARIDRPSSPEAPAPPERPAPVERPAFAERPLPLERQPHAAAEQPAAQEQGRADAGNARDAADLLPPGTAAADRGGWGRLTTAPAERGERPAGAEQPAHAYRPEPLSARPRDPGDAPPPDVLDLAEAQIEPPAPRPAPAPPAPPSTPEPRPPHPDPAAEALRARALTAGDRDPRYSPAAGAEPPEPGRAARSPAGPEAGGEPTGAPGPAAGPPSGADQRGPGGGGEPIPGGARAERRGAPAPGGTPGARPAQEPGRAARWRLEDLEPLPSGRRSEEAGAAPWGGEERPARGRIGRGLPSVGPLTSPAAFPPTGRAYAGFWIRLLAALVDGTILGVVFLAMAAGALAVMGGGSAAAQGLAARLAGVGSLLSLFFDLVVAVYFVFFTWAAGGTPGKAALGLRVVRADGRPIGMGRSLVRFVGYFLELIPGAMLAFFVGGLTAVSAGFVLEQPLLAAVFGGLASLLTFLGYLWVAIDPRKQAWHDKLAGTVVVRS